MSKQHENLYECDINISDCSGRLRDIDEIMHVFTEFYREMPRLSMNDHQLFLEGQEKMLVDVLKYLEKL
jgi:hypothetical protein